MDILLNKDYLPIIENGDFKAGDDIQQQQALLLVSSQGEWKESPLVGCGVINAINDENPEIMIANIKRQFKADGLTITYINYKNGELKIDAKRS